MKTVEKLNILDGIDDKFITEAFPHRLFKMGASPKKDKIVSERHPVRMIEGFVSVAAIFLVIGVIFVWTLVGKDIMNAYHGEDTTTDMTTTEPQTTPTPATTTNNVVVPPIPNTDTTTKPWHTTAPITTTQPITKPLPEVTYEILVIDGEYYLEFSGADAYEPQKDLLTMSILEGLSFNSVDEMYDKIINHKLTKDEMIKMYYEEWGHLNNNRIKVFDLSAMFVPKINCETYLFPSKDIVKESVTWYGDYYIVFTCTDNLGWYFSTRDEESFDEILQYKKDEFSKLELETVKMPDATDRKVGTREHNVGVSYYEQFDVEDNGKKFYVFSEVSFQENKNESYICVYVCVEDGGLYYTYRSEFMEYGNLYGFTVNTEYILGLSYEKIPYVAK